MIPIKQGILAITSQKVLYILMFEIKESLNEKHLEELTLHHFTKIFKVLDFQNFEINQQDIP